MSEPGRLHRRTSGVIAPPPLIYGAGVLFGLLLQRLLPSAEFPAVIRGLGMLLIIGSSVPGPWALFVLFKARTSPEPWHPTTALVEDGPYRYSRNPIYLSFTLFMLGIGLFFSNLWLIVMCGIVLVVVHYGVILREERYLSQLFGERYESYKRRVRRWL